MDIFIDDQAGQEHDAEQPKDGDPHRVPAVLATGIGVPHQEESRYGHQDENRPGKSAFHGAVVHCEDAHHEQRQGAAQNVADHLQRQVAFAVAGLDGEGNRQTDAEEKGREHQVGKAEHIFLHSRVVHPVRQARHTCVVVDPQHCEHRQRPDDIDGGNSFHKACYRMRLLW